MASRNPIIRRAEDQYAKDYSGPGFAAVNTGSGKAGAQPGQAPAAPGSVPPPPPPPGSSAALNEMYAAPARAGASGAPMTIHDVIMKTTLNFAILFVGALFGWFTAVSMPYIWIGAALVAFGFAMVNIFKKQISPVFVMLYALAEGVALGGISYFYQSYGEANGYGNLVLTAVVATFIVFVVMLTLYTTRIVKVTNRFKKVMMVALISYLAFAVVSFIAALFGVGGGFGFFGVGIIGVVFSVFVVILAAFCLCLDFDAIEQGMRYGVPERESWRMAFGLMVTLVWLYLEILRLLAIVVGRN